MEEIHEIVSQHHAPFGRVVSEIHHLPYPTTSFCISFSYLNSQQIAVPDLGEGQFVEPGLFQRIASVSLEHEARHLEAECREPLRQGLQHDQQRVPIYVALFQLGLLLS